MPGYNEERELTDNSERSRFGLPPAARLPALGDPAHLDDLGFGVDSRSSFRVVFSTDADQIAVAPGVFRGNGRRTAAAISTTDGTADLAARIAVVGALHGRTRRLERRGARGLSRRQTSVERSNDAGYREERGWSISAASSRHIRTHTSGLSNFRATAAYAQAYPGTIPYSESIGFTTDLRGWAGSTTAPCTNSRISGGAAWLDGARMQGRQMLNEGLAQYSTFMAFKQYADPVWLRRILAHTHNAYLDARSSETVAEQPVLLTEDQEYISYGKAALALFALQELIGAERVHQALRSYLDKFAEQDPPFPTSRDLVNELRAVAGPEYQRLITDLFEKIMLYDVSIVAAEARPEGNGYEVTMEVAARQFEATGTARKPKCRSTPGSRSRCSLSRTAE